MRQIVMEGHQVRIYEMNTEKLKDAAVFHRYYEMLSQQRCRKVDNYRFSGDKRLSLGAGVLLDRGLSDYGLREAEVSIAYGKSGKPYLPDYPEIHFNLSHSGTMVLAVFSDTEVGCDIERMKEADLALAKRFFTFEEYEYVAKGQEQGYQTEAFYRLWTLKESFLKAVGSGLMLPLNSFQIQIGAENITVSQSVDYAQYYFWECRYGDYFAAVCLRSEN